MTTQTQTVATMLNNGLTVSKLVATHLEIGNVNDVIRRLRRINGYSSILTDKRHDGVGAEYTVWVKAPNAGPLHAAHPTAQVRTATGLKSHWRRRYA